MTTATAAKKRKPRRKAPTTVVDVPNARTLKSMAKKRRFPEAYREHGTILGACAAAGISRGAYYCWTNPKHGDGKYVDLEFCEELMVAEEEYQDRVRTELHRRAIDGWEEPVFGSVGSGPDRETVVVGHVRKYSDRLLELKAKTRLPEYKDTDRPVLNIGITNIQQTEFDPNKMNREQRDLLRQLLTSTNGEVIEGEAHEVEEDKGG